MVKHIKQFVCNFPTNCLRVLEHFVGLALKGLRLELTNQINIRESLYVTNIKLVYKDSYSIIIPFNH